MSVVHLLAVVAFLASGVDRTPLEFTKDSLAVVKENVAKNKAVLVDVRSQEEWNKGHIEGSIFLPVTSLRKGGNARAIAKKLPKKKILYTFCVVGMRAKAAAKTLGKHGYTVRALKPGYDELIEAGFKKGNSKTEAEKSAAGNEDSRQRNAG